MSLSTISRKGSSPTARLLRSSRLFALPQPLPTPQTAPGAPRATQPYPTHQAITTPQSSRCRGDWGLKRPLPGKTTTRTSTPAVSVYELDSIEHITDFMSAADHERTLAKWQEMNLALRDRTTTVRYFKDLAQNPIGIFDSNRDITSKVPTRTQDKTVAPQTGSDPRWRREGPWLAGMTKPEFEAWVEKTVGGRAKGFNAFLERRIREKVEARRKMVARASGEQIAETQTRDYKAERKEVEEQVQHMREQMKEGELRSELGRLIVEYFDLPPLETESDLSGLPGVVSSEDARLKVPRTTHPSAGLSYLRSDSFLENHPILGPQASKTPVEARVLRARTVVKSANRRRALLGVGGIVAEDDIAYSSRSYQLSKKNAADEDAVDRFDPSVEGGKKVWVNPGYTCVSWDGRVQMEVKRAEDDAVTVRRGKVPGEDVLPLPTSLFTGKSSPLDERLDGKSGDGATSSQEIIQKGVLHMLQEQARKQRQRSDT